MHDRARYLTDCQQTRSAPIPNFSGASKISAKVVRGLAEAIQSPVPTIPSTHIPLPSGSSVQPMACQAFQDPLGNVGVSVHDAVVLGLLQQPVHQLGLRVAHHDCLVLACAHTFPGDIPAILFPHCSLHNLLHENGTLLCFVCAHTSQLSTLPPQGALEN